jgi:hypothetical protein
MRVVELRAVVVDAAGHRHAVLGAARVAVDVHGRHRSPGQAFDRLGALAARPAEVAARDADVDLLPRVLPDVADPEPARPRLDRIERDPNGFRNPYAQTRAAFPPRSANGLSAASSRRARIRRILPSSRCRS